MYLIVGLGNPEKKYENTRHNVGFDVIYYLSHKYDCTNVKNQHKGLTSTFMIGGEKVMLCQPLTYMNLSGECILSLADYYNIPDENIIVIYDDIDLPLGEVRVKAKGGPGTHNGMRSVVACLGTRDFPRIRVGIGPKSQQMDLIHFVLSRFTKEEQPVIDKAIERAGEAAIMIVTKGINYAMNEINRKNTKDADSEKS